MPEIADVAATEVIDPDWGNAVRDRTVQRYASAAARTSEHPSPEAGDLSYLEDTGDLDVYHSAAWRHIGPQAGEIDMFGAADAPVGWLLCNGAAVSRTTYAGLFAVIGTTYGAGNGTTTFNVPDLRQRFPIGKAASGTADELGETGGSINHTHSGPDHRHTVPGHNHNGETGVAANATPDGGERYWEDINPTPSGTQTDHRHSIPTEGAVFTAFAGTGSTGSNNPPFIALNFIIKT